MIEDYCYHVNQNIGDCVQCEGYAMINVQRILIQHRRSYQEFDLPAPADGAPDMDNAVKPTAAEEAALADELSGRLNPQQRQAYDQIMAAMNTEDD